MKPEQRTVAIGAASGVAAMVLGVLALTFIIGDAQVLDNFGERIGYALVANVFALVPYFAMLITIGNARFMSDAIDPTLHKESKTMEIDGRVADNTLQQNFVFLVASLALSTIVSHDNLEVIWALAIWFVIARCMFWAGYRINPLYRAPGMSGTAYMNIFMVVYVLFESLVVPFVPWHFL